MFVYAVSHIAYHGGNIVSCGIQDSKVYKTEDEAWIACQNYYNEHKALFGGSVCKDKSNDDKLVKTYENPLFGTEFTWFVIRLEMN